MKLIDEWRKAWKWFSVQAMVLAGTAQAAWMAMPDDLKASLPQNAVQWGTFILLVFGIAGRLVDQEKK
jgi:membrane-anchored protein YejM (alkaline phosphatase superfamily)